MVLLETHYTNLYNSLISNLLEKIVFIDNEPGDIIEIIMPKYLRREQFKNCEKALEDLYYWVDDDFNHELDYLHKIVLYKFMDFIEHKSIRDKNFKNKYFDTNTLRIIEDLLNTGLNKNIINKVYDIKWYLDNLFLNTDFLLIEELYENNKLHRYLINNPEKVKEYFEILPLEYQEKYKYENIDIYNELDKFLDFIDYNIKNCNLALMFWQDKKMIDEPQIQIILENIMEAYFRNKEIDISRETLVGSGEIDFKFYKNKNEKVLFEIKKANNSKLKNGYEKQLVAYMKSVKCVSAYYLIVCYTDEEVKKAIKFIENCDKDDLYYDYIKVKILDVRLKDKAFKNKHRSKLNNDICSNTNRYFKEIDNILKISDPANLNIYFNRLHENYFKLPNDNLKKEYIKKIHQLHYEAVNQAKIIEDFYNKDFYKIYQQEEFLNLALYLLGYIKLESDFSNVIDLLKATFCVNESEDAQDVIKAQKIEEIFAYLKDNHKDFYELLQTVFLEIYLFDFVNPNCSECIPEMNSYKLIFYKVKNPQFNPIMEFFHLLSVVFYMILTDKVKIKMQLNPTQFGEIFSWYLMNDSKFESYNTFKVSKEDAKIIYDKSKELINKALKEVVKK